LTEPLTDKERELRQRAREAEREAEGLSGDRARLALKATLGRQKTIEELAALDAHVQDLTEEAVRSEAQAAKVRSDAELRRSEDERSKLRQAQGLEERIREVANARRQLMIDAGARGASPGSMAMLEIALHVEDQMRQRFGEEAEWRVSADDAEFGLERRDGQLRSAYSANEPPS
jgi:hypothetical protein